MEAGIMSEKVRMVQREVMDHVLSMDTCEDFWFKHYVENQFQVKRFALSSDASKLDPKAQERFMIRLDQILDLVRKVDTGLLEQDDDELLEKEAVLQGGAAIKLLDSLIKKEKREKGAFSLVFFGERVVENLIQVRDCTLERTKYLSAVADFSDDEGMPDEFYDTVFAVMSTRYLANCALVLQGVYSYASCAGTFEKGYQNPWTTYLPSGDPAYEEAFHSLKEVLRMSSLYRASGKHLLLDHLRLEIEKKGGDTSVLDKMQAAVEEMALIRTKKDNPSGLHLNHMKSEKQVYSFVVYDAEDIDEEEMDCCDEYDTEEEAREAAAVFGEDITIFSNPKHERYAVLDKENKNVFPHTFEYELDALTHLYLRTKPQAWMAYVACKEENE